MAVDAIQTQGAGTGAEDQGQQAPAAPVRRIRYNADPPADTTDPPAGEAPQQPAAEAASEKPAEQGEGQKGAFGKIKDTLTELAGREIEESYLTENWQEKANTLESAVTPLRELFGDDLSVNDLIKDLAAFMKKGGNPKEFMKRALVDVDSMTEADKIQFYLSEKHKNSQYKDDLIKHAMKKDYGLEYSAEDLQQLREDNPDAFMAIIRNRDEALQHANAAIAEFKNYDNLIPKERELDEGALKAGADNARTLLKNVSASMKDFEIKLGEGADDVLKIPVNQKDILAMDEVIFGSFDEDGITTIGIDNENLSMQDLVKGLWLVRNFETVKKEMAKHLSTKAELAADKKYNGGRSVNGEDAGRRPDTEDYRTQVRGRIKQAHDGQGR